MSTSASTKAQLRAKLRRARHKRALLREALAVARHEIGRLVDQSERLRAAVHNAAVAVDASHAAAAESAAALAALRIRFAAVISAAHAAGLVFMERGTSTLAIGRASGDVFAEVSRKGASGLVEPDGSLWAPPEPAPEQATEPEPAPERDPEVQKAVDAAVKTSLEAVQRRNAAKKAN